MGRTGSNPCPVAALLGYLGVQGAQCGPLFLFEDGWFLTRVHFNEAVRSGLLSAGVDHQEYCGLSFRIGATMTAAARDVEDSVIKTLGDGIVWLISNMSIFLGNNCPASHVSWLQNKSYIAVPWIISYNY